MGGSGAAGGSEDLRFAAENSSSIVEGVSGSVADDWELEPLTSAGALDKEPSGLFFCTSVSK